MKVTADMSSVDAAASRWDRRARTIQADAAHVVQSHAEEMRADAVGETPTASGHLAGAWAVEKTPKGATIANRARYAGFVLDGELSARVRAKVSARIPSFQPAIVRRQTHGGS